MHIETTGVSVAVAIVAHAWITSIEGPPRVRNLAAWVMAVLLTLVVVFGGLVVR